jgi:chromate reductase, NAD(P)H dehydrogenase (quinone)
MRAARPAADGYDMKVLGISGSLRGGSYNRSLLRAALAEVPDGVEVMAFEGLDALPYFDEDLEAAGIPAVVHFLRRAIAESDALLVVTPEYNGSTSGVLKNALDWASRGPDRVLSGKPVAVMGTSTGRGGAQGGIDAVVRILRRTSSEVLDRTLALPLASEAFDGDRALADPGVSAEVKELMGELVARARTAVALAA